MVPPQPALVRLHVVLQANRTPSDFTIRGAATPSARHKQGCLPKPVQPEEMP
jgi:hypothetical protein